MIYNKRQHKVKSKFKGKVRVNIRDKQLRYIYRQERFVLKDSKGL